MQPKLVRPLDTRSSSAARPARAPTPAAPLYRPDVVALFEYLDDVLQIRDCTHDFRHTKQFLIDHQLEVRPSIAWLRAHGARCDCEVVGKFETSWRAREYLAGIVCRLPKRK